MGRKGRYKFTMIALLATQVFIAACYFKVAMQPDSGLVQMAVVTAFTVGALLTMIEMIDHYLFGCDDRERE